MPGESMKILSFDTGLEQILLGGDFHIDKLPPGTVSLLPSEEHLSRHLDQVFQKQSLEDHLLASMKPSITDSNLLIPSRYHALLEEVHDTLRSFAENPDNSRDIDTIKDAAGVLAEEKELVQLLTTYRNVLHQA